MKNQEDLYLVSFCKDDWNRVIQALRDEAHGLNMESNRAREKGAIDYATLLLEESDYCNALADDIDFILPE